MTKQDRKKVTEIFIQAELQAAEDLGIKLTAPFVREVRAKLKTKSTEVEGQVQFYALLFDPVWSDLEIDDRIFAAVRLLHEYHSGSGRNLPDRNRRIESLERLILRLAEKKSAELPIVQRIKAGEFGGKKVAVAADD